MIGDRGRALETARDDFRDQPGSRNHCHGLMIYRQLETLGQYDRVIDICDTMCMKKSYETVNTQMQIIQATSREFELARSSK